MPIFHYQAIDPGGGRRKGFLEAPDEKSAKQKLREQGVLVVKISQKGSLQRGQNLSHEQLRAVTVMLAQLVRAKIPLYESLVAIEDQLRTERYHRILLSLTEQVKAGNALFKALASFPESFPPLYIAMVQAGESSGSLEVVLDRLAKLLTKQALLRKQITTALIYPALLFGFSLLIIAMLVGFVVPSLEGVFEGRELNSYTQLILSVSHGLRSFWWLFLLLLVGGVSAIIWALRQPAFFRRIELFAMRLPFIGPVMMQAALVRLTRTMGTLHEGGLPLIDALRLSKAVVQNGPLQEELEQMEQRILSGASFGAQVRRLHYLPSMATRMLAIGDESGHLGQMLGTVSDVYEENVEKSIEQALSFLQPVILLVMGALIGAILLAVLLPMADVSSVIR